jgi:hypothetical protein
MSSILGEEDERVGPLGEYNSGSYPSDLREAVGRREEVLRDLVALNVTSSSARIAAIPQLKELLGKYPHPLAYETLLLAYLDDGRFDEARGIAFSARQRRLECASSEYPEIRAEIEGLREWSDDDLEDYMTRRRR